MLRSAVVGLLGIAVGVAAVFAYAQQEVVPLANPPGTAYERGNMRQLLEDWPQLAQYHEADVQLERAGTVPGRVVFMGDSITHGWALDQSFPGKPYVNRGISGQTTPQMLVRFRQDVIDLQPKVVVLLAGTNDIGGNTGEETLEQIEENIASMTDLASANHIRVVLCSVLPAYDYPWNPGRTPAPKISLLNAWLHGWADSKGYEWVDYWSAMKDARGGLPANLSADGVHPLPAGYAVMAPLVEAAIEKSLR